MKKVITRFPIFLANTTPILHNDVLLSQIFEVKIFPKATVHTKNTTLERSFNLKILFQGKGKLTGMDNT
jgi:hypothetical protein